MTELPNPPPQIHQAEAAKQCANRPSADLLLHIQEKIGQSGGWLSFADFMQMALYTPKLGYYSGGAKKFGYGGDFVTAPEISPLFAQTLARQVAPVLAEIPNANILELGAGTGQLAVDLLLSLQKAGQLPEQYYILEVSEHLRQVQLESLQKSLPETLFKRIEWLNALPTSFSGVMLGNEVLDAIPVHIIHTQPDGVYERGIVVEQGRLVWQSRKIEPHSNTQQKQLLEIAEKLALPNDYITEICPAAAGLIVSLASALQQGVLLMIDYGFCAREYYHPQRNLGTLMCHYQQQAHIDPLINIGLQDITAHVDFTSIAYAGVNAGLELSGFCSQAQFLMNSGILEALSEVSPADMARYAPLAAAAQKLLSPAEMGDLFKVIGFSKNIEMPLQGFQNGDKSHTL